MKHRKIVSLTIGVVMTITGSIQAEVTILSDNFESGSLTNVWTGKAGGAHSGVIVADPLDPSNHVVTFTSVTFGGDMFGMPQHVVNGSVQRIVLSFDFLGLPTGETPPPEFGGFAGISTEFAASPFFLAGTAISGVDAPPPFATQLVADGQWHHYEIDFSELAVSSNFTNIQVTLEDFGGNGSVPGDVYFDNISLTATFNTALIDQAVQCSGPAPGKKWKNHGQYVSAVSNVTSMLFTAGLISDADRLAINSAASHSDCGRK